MSRFRIVFRWIRVAILLAAMSGSYVLYRWSREHDPRFYQFLDTAAGRQIARIFHWERKLPGRLLPDKPEAALTAEERAVKRALEAELASFLPTHRLEFVDGRTSVGRVTTQDAQTVTFVESYREQGGISIQFPRARLRAVVGLTNAIPAVSYRDIRFKMEFPALRFYKQPHYSILTDEPFFSIRETVEELERLSTEFEAVFGALVRRPARGTAQVLFFSRKEDYDACRARLGATAESVAGFYDPAGDRLVIFNQIASASVREARERLNHQAQALTEAHAGQAASIESQRGAIDQAIVGEARRHTRSLVRHEAAHQLFFSLGVHSDHHRENTWLIEGLAGWCETSPMGGSIEAYRLALHEAVARDALIPLGELLAIRGPEGLHAAGEARVNLAYAESWALVRALMAPEHRDGFFRYLVHVRDPAHGRDVRLTPPLDLLNRASGVPPAAFDAAIRRDDLSHRR
jgi:hypothetical protein